MTGINRVIFLIESKFSQRDYDRLGVDVITKSGFSVEIWELTPFLHKEVFLKLGESEFKDHKKYKAFYSKRDAVRAIRKLDRFCFVICFIGYNFKTYPIYKALSRNKINYGVFLANSLPLPNYKFNKTKIKKVLQLSKEPLKLIRKLNKVVVLDTIWRFFKVRPARITLLGGEKSLSLYSKFFPIGKETERLWIHSLDYDLYLNENNRAEELRNDYSFAVFLDEYVPFHPDYLLLGYAPFSRPEEYYPSLCRFFTYLENKLGIKIVIAAHPRSDYDKHPDYFEGRQVIKGKTIELIKNSQFVVAHSTTSVNMAVLFQKSIIFISTNSLSISPQGPLIDIMARTLGKRVINIDNACEIIAENDLTINEEVYKKYKNDYIKREGSDELLFWRIFANRLKSMELSKPRSAK